MRGISLGFCLCCLEAVCEVQVSVLMKSSDEQ